jgi:hypothetical protein
MALAKSRAMNATPAIQLATLLPVRTPMVYATAVASSTLGMARTAIAAA